jgi:O-antigen ligase
MLLLMVVHKPFIKLDLFSLKPFMVGMTAVGGVLLLRNLSGQTGEFKIRIAPFILPMITFVIVAGISGLASEDIERSFVLVAAILVCFILYWLIYTLVRSTPNKMILASICQAGVILGIISITLYVLDLAGLVPGLDFVFYGNPNLGEFSGAGRMMGLNNDPNFSAMNMSFYLMISLVTMLWPDMEWKLRTTAILSSLFTGFCIFATLSRGAIFGVVIGFVFFLLIYPYRNLRSMVRYGCLSATWLGVFLLFIYWVVPQDSINFALERIMNVSYSEELERGGRPALWLANIDLLLDHPLLGVGLGNSMIYTEYFSYGYAVQYAHNTFIEILTETGIIGLGIYILVISLILRLIWLARHLCVQSDDCILVSALIVANVTLLIQLQFLSALYDPVVWGLWAVTAGVATRINRELN